MTESDPSFPQRWMYSVMCVLVTEYIQRCGNSEGLIHETKQK